MSFDFSALIEFLKKLFEAFKALAEKFGFDLGTEETTAVA